MKRLWIMFLLLSLCLSCVACNGDGTSNVGTTDTSTESATADGGNNNGNNNSNNNDPLGNLENGPVDLELKWNCGYVASSTHADTPDQLVVNGDRYSYTDVFTIPKAGTTLTFVDDNSNSNGDQMFASKNAYVVSSWIERDGEWEIDHYGFNYAGGTSSDETPVVVKMQGRVLIYSYTTSIDNEHLRLCFRSGETKSFTPEAYPTVTAERIGQKGTGVSKLPLKNWIEGTKADYYNNVLESLTINALGDSYFAGEGLPKEEIWLHLLGAKYNMSMNNYGIGGSTITTCAGYKDPMCVRYTSMKDNDPDIVFLEGGRNDYNKQAPLGNLNSRDTGTFIGALTVTIDGLQQKYPNAMIILISPWNYPPTNSGTVTREMYHEAMRSIAEAQGIYFLDASNPDTIGVDMTKEAFRAQYCIYPTDISHLNAKGMKLVMPKFEKMIAEFYMDFLSKK